MEKKYQVLVYLFPDCSSIVFSLITVIDADQVEAAGRRRHPGLGPVFRRQHPFDVANWPLAAANLQEEGHHDPDLVIQEAVAGKFKDDFVLRRVAVDGNLFHRPDVALRLAARGHEAREVVFADKVLGRQPHFFNINRHLIVRRVVALEGIYKVPLVNPVAVSLAVGTISGVKVFIDPFGLLHQDV